MAGGKKRSAPVTPAAGGVTTPVWTGGNRILAALPAQDLLSIQAKLAPVTLEAGQILYKQFGPIEAVYFPDTAVTSLLSQMDDESLIEVGTIGNEGLVGLPVFLGIDTSPTEVISQIPGTARRMATPDFRAAVETLPALRKLTGRCTHAFMTQVSQTAACNRLHKIEQRCARWLLLTHDRVGGADSFPLTHKFLSLMLGVRRAGVTEAMGVLAKAKLIKSTPGRVTILDRSGLEAACCECYRIVRFSVG
jgi:CRP-like cAMP-binding protein